MKQNIKTTKSKLAKLSKILLTGTTIFLSPHLLSTQSVQTVKTQTIKTVAITQIVPHQSLEEAKQGLLETLKLEGYEPGKNLVLLDENAHGNITTANLIAKKFVGNKKVDVIVPISTPSALSVKSAAKGLKIPIVFSSVSDPVGVGLVKSLETADQQITGAMDFPAVAELQSLMKTLSPKMKKIGVLYNSGEDNSVKTVKAFNEKLAKGFEVIEKTVPNSKLVPEAVLSLITKVDAIYIPSDNTVFSAMQKVVQLTRQHKIPTFTNDPDSVKLGVFACYGYSQYAVGQTAGFLVAQILNGAPVSSLKVRAPAKAEIFVNHKTAKLLDIKVPAEFDKQKILQVDK